MSPYSSLNNTGIYDSGFASSKSGGFDTVSQVDRWLKNVEYNLDQTEQAVQQKGASSNANHASRVAPQTSSGFASHQNGYGRTAGASGLNGGRRYDRSGSQGQTQQGGYASKFALQRPSATSEQSPRSWSNNENIHNNNYSSYSGSKGVGPSSGLHTTMASSNGHQKKAILRNQQSGVGSLQRSQSLGRGQLASSLANLKARMGSRGSSRERSLSRLSNHGGQTQTIATNSQMNQQLSMRRINSSSSRASSSSSSSGSSSRVCTGHSHSQSDRQSKHQLQRSISEPSHHYHSQHQHQHQHQHQQMQKKPTYSTLRSNAKSPPLAMAAEQAQDLSMMDPNAWDSGMGFGSDPTGEGTASGAGASPGGGALHQCAICSRTFNAKALEKHMKICQKVFQSKRPKFSSKEARLSGLEKVDNSFGNASAGHSQYGRYGSSSKSSRSRSGVDNRPIVSKQTSKPKWKVKSEQFRAAMMAARGVDMPSSGSGQFGGGGAPPVDDGLIPCPHCGRTFNETAAERHIERCKNIKARPKALKAGAGRTAGAYSSRRSASSSSSSYGRF